MKELIDMLRVAPESQLDPEITSFIASWEYPPKAIDVLRALDEAVYGGGASQLAMMALEEVLRQAMQADGVTYKELTNRAMWREDMN